MPELPIPGHCGAIALPDTVLFPHGALPLHIFEPRYRQLLKDSLESHFLFCVGRLTDSSAEDLEAAGFPISPTGTIARVRAARQLPNGHYLLILVGLSRVRFSDWTLKNGYPFAQITPLVDTTLTSEEDGSERLQLRQASEKILSRFPSEIREQIAEGLDRAPNAAALADTIAQQFIHDPRQRQKLLDLSDTRERIARILSLLSSLES
ncbi:MAG: LON peptidase substrate-binding domain-containing protein [Verrucomicrobiales bacterium]